MIGVVNYGSGNIQAIANIYNRLNIPFVIASDPAELEHADRILLPGVGAFDQAMEALDQSGMRNALNALVLNRRIPVLGICVGMQLLARSSEEGSCSGLGWIRGVVKRFDRSNFRHATHLPHMGWNTVEPQRADPIFGATDFRPGYYFLHSYYFECDEKEDELAHTEYGIRFTCVVRHGNVYGVQFHPEKSHQAGIQLLKNFATAV